ncbi:hypothetical protein PtB15_11B303 [Puccinia triticina]|nr:hypothetical protein PtB15_11B303 [Puccinia triticina]
MGTAQVTAPAVTLMSITFHGHSTTTLHPCCRPAPSKSLSLPTPADISSSMRTYYCVRDEDQLNSSPYRNMNCTISPNPAQLPHSIVGAYPYDPIHNQFFHPLYSQILPPSNLFVSALTLYRLQEQ